jgi:hypothetical protein
MKDWLMFAKGCRALICMIAVSSLSAFGHSLGPLSAEQIPPWNAGTGTLTGTLPGPLSKEFVIFASALADAPKRDSVTLLNTESSKSHPIDPPDGYSRLASLPEPGSGILLGLGFLAVVPLARRRRTVPGKV